MGNKKLLHCSVDDLLVHGILSTQWLINQETELYYGAVTVPSNVSYYWGPCPVMCYFFRVAKAAPFKAVVLLFIDDQGREKISLQFLWLYHSPAYLLSFFVVRIIKNPCNKHQPITTVCQLKHWNM